MQISYFLFIKKAVNEGIFLVRMCRFFLASDTIDISCLDYANFSTKKNNILRQTVKIGLGSLDIFPSKKFE